MAIHYDIVISGGHVIDPANGIDGFREVAITGDRIAAVAERLPPHIAGHVIDATGQVVTPGLVDLHAHLFWGRDYLGIDADSLAWRCGVTTWVDAGSAGAFSMPGFRQYMVRRSTVRMLAFINISYLGIAGLNYDEYCNPKACDVPLLARVVEENRDLIVGIKVRMGKEGVCYPGLRPLRKAVEAAEATGLPIMCHISNSPPSVDSVLALLRPGDIVTHAFTGGGQRLIDRRGNVRPAALRAREAGIRFDIGHGAGSFSFASGRSTCPARVLAGHDLHRPASDQPRRSESGRRPGDHASHPRRWHAATHAIDRDDEVPLPWACRWPRSSGPPPRRPQRRSVGTVKLGMLEPGSRADVAILRVEPGSVEFVDIYGTRRSFDRKLEAMRTLWPAASWSREIPAAGAALDPFRRAGTRSPRAVSGRDEDGPDGLRERPHRRGLRSRGRTRA